MLATPTKTMKPRPANFRHSGGAVRVPNPAESAAELLPTPRATDGTKGGPNQRGSSGDLMLPSAVLKLLPTPPAADSGSGTWGKYGPAIKRWEQVIGRPAPQPTEPGRNGNRRLSPRFVEWLMGVDEGWVTGVPGLSRNRQLELLGNGVVKTQAVLALQILIPMMEET